MVQWLGLCVSTEGDPGSNPGQGTKIPQATQGSQKKKKRPTSQNDVPLLLTSVNMIPAEFRFGLDQSSEFQK